MKAGPDIIQHCDHDGAQRGQVGLTPDTRGTRWEAADLCAITIVGSDL